MSLRTTVVRTCVDVFRIVATTLRIDTFLQGCACAASAMVLCATLDAHAAPDSPISSVPANGVQAATQLPDLGAKRVVTIDAVAISYREMGDPNAETLVFLHGAGGILSTGKVGPLLAQRYHVLMPSLPGFDDTPRGNNQTLADVTELVARFIAQVSKPPVYVAGQSLGGRTASWLAIVHPELVRKLVLSAPATLARNPPQLPVDDEAAKQMLARWLLGTEEAASQFKSEQIAAQRTMLPLLADYSRLPSREMFLARLQDISAPTLLLWGNKDSLLHPDEGPQLFGERIRNLRVQYLNGAHGLPVTNAREYVDYTFAFLNDNGRSVAAANTGTAFNLTSAAFDDGGAMARKYAGAASANRACDGENVSPPLQWTNAPRGTQSFAIIMFDPEGRKGLGVSHWVAYGIPADRTSMAEGDANLPDAAFVNGKNIAASQAYLGPCPPFGDVPHHYIFTVIATDLAPQALQPGLSEAALLAALDKHALAAASLVGRYGH